MAKRQVAFNEHGQRIGEGHHKAACSDREVELARRLHAEGRSYAWLAGKFGVSKSCVAWWCRYQRRAQLPAGVKEVHVPPRKRGK